MRDTDAPQPAADVAEIAERFVTARLNAHALSDYPGTVPGDLDTAYRCQELAIQRWPDRIAGWKVARVPAAFKERYPQERLIGPAFSANVHLSHATNRMSCI